MAYFKPQRHLREGGFASGPTTALVFIDTQNYNCHADGAIYQSLSDDAKNVSCAKSGAPARPWPSRRSHRPAALQSPETRHFYDGVAAAVPRWQAVAAAARAAGAEVVWTVIQSLTADGRDRGRDYVISGFHVPPGSWDARVLEGLGPGPDDMVLPKTSSSVFSSTTLHYVLGNMGVTHVALLGCVTDQCVEHAVRDACDLGYLVTMVTGERRRGEHERGRARGGFDPKLTALAQLTPLFCSDGCVTYSEERQAASLAAVAGYCRQRTAAEVMAELEALARGVTGG